MKELSTLAFAARKENVIFFGPPGVGKTHLAVGLAMKAIQAGMTVLLHGTVKTDCGLEESRHAELAGTALASLCKTGYPDC